MQFILAGIARLQTRRQSTRLDNLPRHSGRSERHRGAPDEENRLIQIYGCLSTRFDLAPLPGPGKREAMQQAAVDGGPHEAGPEGVRDDASHTRLGQREGGVDPRTATPELTASHDDRIGREKLPNGDECAISTRQRRQRIRAQPAPLLRVIQVEREVFRCEDLVSPNIVPQAEDLTLNERSEL